MDIAGYRLGACRRGLVRLSRLRSKAKAMFGRKDVSCQALRLRLGLNQQACSDQTDSERPLFSWSAR